MSGGSRPRLGLDVTKSHSADDGLGPRRRGWAARRSVLRVGVGGQGDGHVGLFSPAIWGPLPLASQRGRAAAVGAVVAGGLGCPYAD
jgi:hypothetical protein